MSDGFPRILTPFLKKELLRFSRKTGPILNARELNAIPQYLK